MFLWFKLLSIFIYFFSHCIWEIVASFNPECFRISKWSTFSFISLQSTFYSYPCSLAICFQNQLFCLSQSITWINLYICVCMYFHRTSFCFLIFESVQYHTVLISVVYYDVLKSSLVNYTTLCFIFKIVCFFFLCLPILIRISSSVSTKNLQIFWLTFQ